MKAFDLVLSTLLALFSNLFPLAIVLAIPYLTYNTVHLQVNENISFGESRDMGWNNRYKLCYPSMQFCEEAILCCTVKLQLKWSDGVVAVTSCVMNEEELVS